MKKKLTDIDKFNYLFEFQIKSGVNQKPDDFDNEELDKKIISNLNKAMGDESTVEDETENEQVVPEPIENKTDVEIEKKDDDVDALTVSLLKTQSNKIDQLFDFVNRLTNVVKDNKMEIDSIQQVIEPKVDNLEKRVEKLEPPLPIEQLNTMVKISGGLTPDEYWSNYLKRNGVSAENPNIYYNSPQYHENQKGQNNTIGRQLTDNDIKNML